MNSNAQLNNVNKIYKLINNNGASVRNGETALHQAAFRNQPKIIDTLVSFGVPIDAVNKQQKSALHVAVHEKNLECVKALLRLNCNVNLQDNTGSTALSYAIAFGPAEIVDALCSSNRVDFGKKNWLGYNVLQYAAHLGNAYAVKYLMLKAPHLVNVREENSGFTALHLAADMGHRNVAATLLSHQCGKAQVNCQSNQLQTPLHRAIINGHWNLVELLLQHKADISRRDKDGNTVLHIAINTCRNQSNIAPTADARRDAPQIDIVWQELSRRGARPELALICFVVSQDTSGTLLEQARNRQNQTPIGLLAADSEFAPFVNTVRSYKGQDLRLICASMKNEMISFLKDQDLNSGNGGSRFESSQIYQGYQIDNDRLKREIEKEKAKNDYLETKIASLEEVTMCKICMEGRKNVAFLCGHGACERCAAPLKICHMCRQTISKKISLY